MEVIRRVLMGVYNDGFIHAGNLAYLSLLAVFSFFIAAAAIVGVLGQSEQGGAIIGSVFSTVPPGVAAALREPVSSAMTARTGPLLWFSGLIALWTVASLIETIRDILHRAYGVSAHRPFWQYRIGSIMGVVASVFVLMVALSANVMVVAVEQFVAAYVPWANRALDFLLYGRVLPFVSLLAALYILFRSLTPRDYRERHYPKWPGAVLVSGWWVACTVWLPWFLSHATNYDLTYGSLAGVMIALIFFYIIGLGMVTGAELNAALANQSTNGLESNATTMQEHPQQ